MNYKRLTEQQEKELINVLCGDYDLKATLKYVDGLMDDNYDKAYYNGYNDGFMDCKERYER